MQGTWRQAILSVLFPVFILLGIRWLIVEPFLIPSGSMLPNLLINDHILVEKFSYGLRWPFTHQWLFQFAHPKRGDIVVFRSVHDDHVFIVKRVIGKEGDRIRLQGSDLFINDQKILHELIDPRLNHHSFEEFYRENEVFNYDFFYETIDQSQHVVMYSRSELKKTFDTDDDIEEDEIQKDSDVLKFEVPEGHLFFLGDNRSFSQDSRYWGTVPVERIIGPVLLVWLSCREMLYQSDFICDPQKIRVSRFFSWL